MERIFTRNVGRFKAGEVRDYPAQTWATLAANANMSLSAFSKAVHDAAADNVRLSVGGKGK